jgi:hypothetical protein
MYTIRIYSDSNDPAYNSAPINLWSFIEINLGIVCACAPGMLLWVFAIDKYANHSLLSTALKVLFSSLSKSAHNTIENSVLSTQMLSIHTSA